MKNYTNTLNRVIEMVMVEAFIAALCLVGLVMPAFGDFLTEPVVVITVIGSYVGLTVHEGIKIYEEYRKQNSLHKEEL